MTTQEIRQKFLQYFQSQGHKIVPSAPIVNKNDPTLMFTNAGMNQFKDYFLGNRVPEVRRVADTQKCLRVSGKHNDLEDVGFDGYHHTMFEMLGNWSFGDYFKREAISWAWELLTREYGINPKHLYVTVFAGDAAEGLARDDEAAGFWKSFLPEDRILYFGKKDNFWEMGDTGPCGPCSEIHVDIRPDADREAVDARELVNAGHPGVIEIWNLVFIQFNRKADSSLEELPEKHVDTGMGFERLCMVLQGKSSSYDTDLLASLIHYISQACGKAYTYSYDPAVKSDTAMRVVADHVRAVAFTLADGELPGNTGPGYVVRRILRRAVRYYYSFLDLREPLLYRLVDILVQSYGGTFPELDAQKDFVARVIEQEERSFLRTLEGGLKRMDAIIQQGKQIDGQTAFELYDTYGFPIDLTRLIARERGLHVDEAGFDKALKEQRERSRADASKSLGDWFTVREGGETRFVGYEEHRVDNANLLRFRQITDKTGTYYQLVPDITPFYPEGGGQEGDTGELYFGEECIPVENTVRENELILHLVRKMPANPQSLVSARIDSQKRRLTENNHSATHLLHAALRKVLGDHVHQKGSLLNDKYLRFDFSHFQKMSEEEIQTVEEMVNTQIRANLSREEARGIPIEEAKKAGAMMLFGEKYGEKVRMITFDPSYSVELCGGCHVPFTGQIGLFKIVAETSIAAGVRRIEAITAAEADRYVQGSLQDYQKAREVLKAPRELAGAAAELLEENRQLKKEVERLQMEKARMQTVSLQAQMQTQGAFRSLVARLDVPDAKVLKTIAHEIEQAAGPSVLVMGAEIGGKPLLQVMISRELLEGGFSLKANEWVSSLARHIRGGGGGQAFFATAGGQDAAGLDAALDEAREKLGSLA